MRTAPISLRIVAATILGAGFVAASSVPALAADVTRGRLENADGEPQNWLTAFQNYGSHSYTRLAQINRSNVASLKVAWTQSLGTGLNGRASVQFESRPLVDDGFLYYDDAAGNVYKVDGRSGNRGIIVWRTDVTLSKDEGSRTRGLSFWANNVYDCMNDARCVAVSRDTGEVVWDKQIGRVAHPKGANVNLSVEGFTQSPLAVDGKIIIGNAKGDSGSNGWVAAVDAAKGTEIWRTYTVPGPGEPGHETWKDDHQAWKTGGASLWTMGSYDVGQRLLIEGAAQPVPMYDPEFRPGDNLYSNSAIAFDIETGKIKWYFQYTPNESWDYDEQGAHMLIDAPFGGSERKMVTHFGRNGFYYQLDRTNGAYISADKWVDLVTWTAGIDPKTGKPAEYNPNLALQTYIPATRYARADAAPKQACPAVAGGARWQPPAYNPVKRIAYQSGEDGCQSRQIVAVVSVPGGGNIEPDAKKNPGGRTGTKPGTSSTQDLHGNLAAVDVTTGKIITRLRMPFSGRGGVLATAGGLIFTTTVGGAITAHDDQTLAELWRFETGIPNKAAPMAYSVAGKQFIAVMAGAPADTTWPEIDKMVPGAMIFVFSL